MMKDGKINECLNQCVPIHGAGTPYRFLRRLRERLQILRGSDSFLGHFFGIDLQLQYASNELALSMSNFAEFNAVCP